MRCSIVLDGITSCRQPVRDASLLLVDLPSCAFVPFGPQVKQMSSEDTEHKELFKRNLSHSSLAALAGQQRDEEQEFTVRTHLVVYDCLACR